MKRITKIETARGSGGRKLRVAAYARVSTDSNEQLASLESQKNHYERYIKEHRDWEYAGLYYDEGLSGTSMVKRDGLLRMLEDCDKGLVDYIIVKSISRFSRNTVDSIETVRRLCERGIYIFFEKENIDTGKMEGELLLSILSSLAESESHSIAENNKWSIQKRYQNGTFKIGYPPYGYDNINGQMVINEEQAEIVREIFDGVLSGKSPGTVARELNERMVSTKRGGTWSGHTVSGMIRNEKYTGDMIMQKTYTDDRFNRHINRGELTRYLARNHHEPIVSHETFDAANAIIDENGLEKGIHKDEGKYKNRYAMSGKIICGEYGGTWKRVKLAGHFGYSCKTHVRDKNGCSMKSIAEEPVKAAFITLMNKLTFGRSLILLPYAETMKKRQCSENAERLAELDELLEKNTERRQQIVEFFTKGLLEPAVYTQECNGLTEEAERLTAERDSVTTQMSGNRDQQVALDRLLKYTAKGVMIEKFEPSLFTEHVDHIVVYERTEIGFAMKCGPVFRERI